MEQPKINTRLLGDIVQYCAMNNLDIEQFINDVLRKGFMVEKYGERPGVLNEIQPKRTKEHQSTEVVVEEKQQVETTKENHNDDTDTPTNEASKNNIVNPVETKKTRKLQVK